MRAAVASTALSSLLAAGPAAAEPGARPNTWTLPGCDVRLATHFVPATAPTRGGRWTLAAHTTCVSPQGHLELRADLRHRDVAVPNSFVESGCDLATKADCTQLTVTRSHRYQHVRGLWQAEIVLFILGPTSLAVWASDDRCVLDLPSARTICTFRGQRVRLP